MFKLLNFARRCKPEVLMGGILLVLLVCSVASYNVKQEAGAIGESLVTGVGTVVGRGKANLEYAETFQAGYDKGKKDGLEGDKTTLADIMTKTNAIGKLEVLVAGIGVTNYHTVGEKYAALYLMKADVVYTVDLSQAEVGYKDEAKTTLNVYVPYPKAEVYFDSSEIQKVAEWQKNRFSGDAADGSTAFLNSAKEVEKKVTAEIEEDEALLKTAEDAAKRQIQMLVGNICMDAQNINVIFE